MGYWKIESLTGNDDSVLGDAPLDLWEELKPELLDSIMPAIQKAYNELNKVYQKDLERPIKLEEFIATLFW